MNTTEIKNKWYKDMPNKQYSSNNRQEIHYTNSAKHVSIQENQVQSIS